MTCFRTSGSGPAGRPFEPRPACSAPVESCRTVARSPQQAISLHVDLLDHAGSDGVVLSCRGIRLESLARQCQQVVGPLAVCVGSQILRANLGSHYADVRTIRARIFDVGLAVLVLDPRHDLSARVVAGVAVGRVGPPKTGDVLVAFSACQANGRDSMQLFSTSIRTRCNTPAP
jgi:hypothetical protein